MKRKAAGAAPRRTTLAVNGEFGRKLAELAHDRGLSVAEYCDRHLGAKVAADWRNMLRRKLGADPKAGA